MPKLLVRTEGLEDLFFELKPGVVAVGRGADNGLQIAHPSVSTHHAELELDADAPVLRVRDLDSTNGTFVDGRRVETAELRDGQSVRFGSSEAVFMTGDVVKAKMRVSVAGGQTLAAPPPPLPLMPPPATKAAVERNYFQRLPGAFLYPFQGDGGMILVAGTVVFSAADFLGMFAFWLSTVVSGYMAAYLQSLVATSAQGDDKPPGYPDFSDFYSDIVQPLLQVLACVMLCFGPAWLYRVFGDPNNDLVFVSLLVAGGLYFPMGLLCVCLNQSLAALNPILVILSIFRAPLEYLAACVLLAGAYACDTAIETMLPSSFLGGIASHFISLYFLMVEMRFLGLLYRCKRRALAWHAE